MLDIVDTPQSGNPLRLPPMVALTVTIAQGVTIFLIPAFMSDLIEAVLKLQDGYYPEVLEKHPGATYSTWLFSCSCQATAGILLLVTIFILTMQVDSVLSIMLNFAALHFMAEIDDLGFQIAKMGFVRRRLQEQTEEVLNFQVPLQKQRPVFQRRLY
jgi:hypothetical protein